MTFDYDKAKAALLSDPSALALLESEKTRLIGLAPEAIMDLMLRWVKLDDQGVIVAFMSLDDQAAAMVKGSADVADRQAAAKERALIIGSVLTPLVIKVLLAGVGLPL